MLRTLKDLVNDERGLETVEYAIITGLIVGGTITAIGLIGSWVFGQFTAVEEELSSSSGG